jgi:hypothetical protein
MAENYALYSRLYTSLPKEQMLELVEGREPEVRLVARGLTYVYRWPDLSVMCSEMPRERLAEHLAGFVGYIRHISEPGATQRANRLIDAILGTTLVVGIEAQPGRDDAGRVNDILGRLCGGLQPIMFFDRALYDADSRLLLGPDGSFDPRAIVGPSA